MIFLNFKKLLKSFKYAFEGLKAAFREQIFRILCFIALLVIILMIYLRVSFYEKIVLILVIVLVLTLELINSQIEKVLDILEPNYNHKIKVIKDMSAAAVLLASLGALIIGILIFWPHLV